MAQYRVQFGSDMHAQILVEDVGEGSVEGGDAVGGEAFRDAALEEGYIVERIEDGEPTDAFISADSRMIQMGLPIPGDVEVV